MTGFDSKREMAADKVHGYDWSMLEAAQESLREHMARIKELEAQLAQPAQEPVAWMSKENNCIFFDADNPNPMDYDFWTPLYTTPPKREWVGLTPEETSGFTQHEMTVVKYVSKVLLEKNG